MIVQGCYVFHVTYAPTAYSSLARGGDYAGKSDAGICRQSFLRLLQASISRVLKVAVCFAACLATLQQVGYLQGLEPVQTWLMHGSWDVSMLKLFP